MEQADYRLDAFDPALDFSTLADWDIATWRQSGIDVGLAESAHVARIRRYVDRILGGAGRIAVARHGNETVGIACLDSYGFCGRTHGLIQLIYVDSRHRRQGLGRRLLTEIIASAQTLGFDEIEAFIALHNDDSLRLFAACGWKQTRIVSNYYFDRTAGP